MWNRLLVQLSSFLEVEQRQQHETFEASELTYAPLGCTSARCAHYSLHVAPVGRFRKKTTVGAHLSRARDLDEQDL